MEMAVRPNDATKWRLELDRRVRLQFHTYPALIVPLQRQIHRSFLSKVFFFKPRSLILFYNVLPSLLVAFYTL